MRMKHAAVEFKRLHSCSGKVQHADADVTMNYIYARVKSVLLERTISLRKQRYC